MLRRILIGLVVLASVVAAAAGYVLYAAHRQMVELAPTIPSLDRALAADTQMDLPVRASWLNTATQTMPRSAVIEPSVDPKPDAPYVMSHPAFVLEWADGRKLLFDVGMTSEQAVDFGRPIESMMGADSMRPLAAAGDQLGADAASVHGVAFSHLHEDHVGGLHALCEAVGHPIRVFQQDLQAEHTNYLTSAGAALIETADCAERVRVDADGRLDGFPGVRLISVGGHTPGSQILVARVSGELGVDTWIFTGDVVNNIDGIEKNLPKPYTYSRFVVPENSEQLDLTRRWLKSAEEAGARLAVNHDQLQLEASGLPQG